MIEGGFLEEGILWLFEVDMFCYDLFCVISFCDFWKVLLLMVVGFFLVDVFVCCVVISFDWILIVFIVVWNWFFGRVEVLIDEVCMVWLCS